MDATRLARRKAAIRGLIELDITETRRRIRAYRARTGQPLSLTGFVIHCLARTAATHPHLHAYRNWRNQLVLFDEVDVMTVVETRMADQVFPLAHVVRVADRKSPTEITREIQAVQRDWLSSSSGRMSKSLLVRIFAGLPWALRYLIYLYVLARPQLLRRYAGTVGVTAVGMFGAGGGWGIGLSNHTLGLTLGGVARRPGIVEGRIEPREYLGVTFDVDHDIVDGAAGARFVRDFRRLMERARSLDV